MILEILYFFSVSLHRAEGPFKYTNDDNTCNRSEFHGAEASAALALSSAPLVVDPAGQGSEWRLLSALPIEWQRPPPECNRIPNTPPTGTAHQ